MGLSLEKPLVFVDLEATGVDALRDRIVQVACVRLSPDGSRAPLESLVDPQVPIPPESTEVHGITDAAVRGKPTFRALAPRLLEFFGDCDFGGFGIVRYDLPLLAAEFKRAGMAFDFASRRLVDALLIYHRFEPRNLSAALKFYCGKPLEHAHDARADAEASLEVLLAQLERYREGPKALPSDMRGLHEFCCAQDPRHVDAKGKFVWRHGAAAFNFGKHQTKLLEEVARQDRSYLEWLAKADSTPADVADICRKALAGFFPQKKNLDGAS